jgi:hypothetical protein
MVQPIYEGKPDDNREMLKTWFSRFDKYTYRCLVLSENDLRKYRYIRANYDIVQITELYFFKVVSKALNG